MKIIFLFDQVDAEGKLVANDAIPFVTTPDKLNLRQLQPGMSSIGILFEQPNEKGEQVQYFRQIVNFPIDLKQPEPVQAAPTVPVGVASPAPSAPVAEAVKPKVKRTRKSTAAPVAQPAVETHVA